MSGGQMHVLLTNDDGPPNKWHSPYIQPLVNQILSDTDWLLTVVVPERQRSWIGKAHMIGEGVKASYLYTKGLEEESAGPFEAPKTDLRNGTENWTEWTLLAATPASCANIGHKFIGPRRQNKPVDLVISGPNYGRNTSAAYIMSSGTVGAAVEAAINGSRSIALSFSYTRPEHTAEEIENACKLSLDIIRQLVENWDDGVEVYSINVPLFAELDPKNPPPIRFVPILGNKWSSIFNLEVTNDGAEKFHWSPDYEFVDRNVFASGPGSDAWTVMHNEVSISAFKGIFQNVDVGDKDLKL